MCLKYLQSNGKTQKSDFKSWLRNNSKMSRSTTKKKMTGGPSEDSRQPEHPHRLTRAFAVRFTGCYKHADRSFSGTSYRLWLCYYLDIFVDYWACARQNQHMTWAPSEDSDQSGHPPSLISVVTVPSKDDSQGQKASSCGQRSLWSDWADSQADLSLCWAQMSVSCYSSFTFSSCESNFSSSPSYAWQAARASSHVLRGEGQSL